MALKQRLVVVGTGSIGRRHARLLAKRKDIAVELYDPSAESISETLQETGMLRTYPSFDQMLKSKPDMVLIASPHEYHTDQTLRSLEAGAHVLCEKPMSDQLDSANEVLRAVNRTNRVLVYGFSNHFHPGVLKIKEKLERDQLGELQYIHLHVGTYGTLINSRSRYQATTHAALLTDYVHQPDLLYWLLGENPIGVYAVGSLGGKLELTSNPNSVTMILDYQKPLTASIHLNYLQYPDRCHYELLGDHGWIFYDLNSSILYFGDRNQATVGQEKINFDRDSIYEAEHQAFFDTIAGKRPAESSADDAFKSMMVVEAAIRSWKTKQRVALEQVISSIGNNFTALLWYLCFWLSVFDLNGQDVNQSYDLTEHYGKNNGLEPTFIRESPMNEATAQVFDDGKIKIFHTPERFSDQVLSITSTDNGYTWSEPKLELEDPVIWQYPRRTLIDQNGDLHLLVFKRENLDVLHTKTSNDGESWSPFLKIADGRIGAIRGFIQTQSGRLIFGFHRGIAERKPPYGQCFTSSVYSDDRGATWVESSSKLLTPVYEGYIGNNYGFVEPNIVELKDGRIWLLGRTQTGYLYQSLSNDQGETWSAAEASIFRSSNSPANILKFPDGRLVLSWCNTVDPDINDFGRIYTHRDVLHMAVSDDDGHSWRGFREIMRIPTRNDQNDMPSGDSGTSYPNTAYTKEGKIILVTGQGEHGGGKAIWIIDPEWLYETELEDDFSNGLEKWTAYTFTKLGLKPGRTLGPRLVDDASARGGKVLQIRKSDPHLYGDAAVWNFPMGRIGAIELKIKLPVDSKGASISLTDCHRHPNDPNGYKQAMFSFLLGETGSVDLTPDQWHLLKLKWNLDTRDCQIYVDNEFKLNVPLIHDTGMGISYIRFHSAAPEGQADKAGLMLDWIKSVSNAPYSDKAF